MTESAATTRTLARGLELLEHIARAQDGVSVTALADLASLDKATASRLLATLRELGWARQDARDRRYRLTGKMAHLWQIHPDRLNLQAVARPHLTGLRDKVNETVHLGVMSDAVVVYVDKLESSSSIRLVSTVGQQMPILTTALGRAMLAALPEDEREERVRSLALVRRTSRTISDKHRLLRELIVSARRGYAIDHEQNEAGVSCVAAAVFDSVGAPAAAISVSGPTFRMASKFDSIGRACRRTAAAIALDLGSVAAEEVDSCR